MMDLEQRKREALEAVRAIRAYAWTPVKPFGSLVDQMDEDLKCIENTLRELCQPVGEDVEEAVDKAKEALAWYMSDNCPETSTVYLNSGTVRTLIRAIRGEKQGGRRMEGGYWI